MKKVLSLIFLIGSLLSCTERNKNEPHILIQTGYGDIEVVLYPTKAPKTVAAILSYIDSGYYKKATFYRVLKNENVPKDYNSGLIQGGIYYSDNARHLKLKGIEHESPKQTGLSHVSGSLSMARMEVGTAKSEFFICIGNQKQFDSSIRGTSDGYGYAVFGKVVRGMKVAMKIQNKRSKREFFVDKIVIDNIIRY